MPPASSQSTNLMASVVPDIMRSSSARHIILYDVATRFVPGILTGIGCFIVARFKKRTKKLYEKMLSKADGKLNKTGSVMLERNFKGNASDTQDMFDAVLALASDLPQAQFIKRTNDGIFIVDTDIEIGLAPDISFRRVNVKNTGDTGDIESMVVEVFSIRKDVVEIRDYLVNIEAAYKKTRCNQLGRQLYYFDEMQVIPPMVAMRGTGIDTPAMMKPDLSKAPPTYTFQMFALHTNKSMKNIYGGSVSKLKKRVDFFLKNEDWYKEKGIPYTLGILLSGKPGTGKTSTIKALARDCGRHVVNVKLSEYTTVSQINNFFYTSRLGVVRDGVTTAYDIPIDKRIIVMEDIDCLSSIGIVGKRTDDPSVAVKEGLNLSVLLNILDGVLETPGRILIMTSNKPDMLDDALVRPGRVDLSIEFTKCCPDDIMDMIEGFNDVKIDRSVWKAKLPDKHWTPAEVCKVIFENMGSTDNALESLTKPIYKSTMLPLPLPLEDIDSILAQISSDNENAAVNGFVIKIKEIQEKVFVCTNQLEKDEFAIRIHELTMQMDKLKMGIKDEKVLTTLCQCDRDIQSIHHHLANPLKTNKLNVDENRPGWEVPSCKALIELAKEYTENKQCNIDQGFNIEPGTWKPGFENSSVDPGIDILKQVENLKRSVLLQPDEIDQKIQDLTWLITSNKAVAKDDDVLSTLSLCERELIEIKNQFTSPDTYNASNIDAYSGYSAWNA